MSVTRDAHLKLVKAQQPVLPLDFRGNHGYRVVRGSALGLDAMDALMRW